MNARPKKKLCWNCETNVSLKTEVCPCCGVSVIGLSSDIASEAPPPPYRLVNPSQEQAIPISPYLNDDEEGASEDEISHQDVEENVSTSLSPSKTSLSDESKKTVLIMSLLILGSVFFIFGFTLLLFSSEGYLTLHWNASYWFVYLLLAIPMMYFGFRLMNFLHENDSDLHQ